jgi:hypothetical protein
MIDLIKGFFVFQMKSVQLEFGFLPISNCRH